MAVTVLDVAQLIGARMQGGTAEQAQAPITEVGLNSAELPAGALFAAVPGTRVHGARFAADTAAAAILTDEAGWGLLSAAGETGFSFKNGAKESMNACPPSATVGLCWM